MVHRQPRIPISLHQTTIALLCLWGILLCLPGWLSAGEVEVIDGVRHVHNGAEPADGDRTLQLEEIWRVNVEEEENLIGVITAMLAGPDGTVWLADHQLSQIFVYSAEGEYLRTLSGEGEGPGEVNAPDNLIWLPDGSLGIIDRKPGQITRLDTEGVPLSSLHLKSANGEPMGFSQLGEAQCRAGILGISGTEFRFDDGVPTQNRFFGIYDLEGGEVCRLLEAPTGFDFEARTYHEMKNYFVDEGGWTLDGDGRVHLVPERNHYQIHIYDGQWRLIQVYGRKYELWRRTAEERKEAAGGTSMTINGEFVEITTTIDDYEPAIMSIMASANDQIWVLSSRGTREQPEGVQRSYDVFDTEGHYREVVRLVVELDDREDRLYRLADGRWIILHNIRSAMESMYGVPSEDDTDESTEEDDALEIVCLRAVRQ